MNSKEYQATVFPIKTENGISYMATFVDVPGCVGGGDSPIEALQEAYENLDFHLECLAEEGKPIPVPSKEIDFSGKFVVRTTKSMHEKLYKSAKAEGVSMNSYINYLLSANYHKYEILNDIKNCISDSMQSTFADYRTMRSVGNFDRTFKPFRA